VKGFSSLTKLTKVPAWLVCSNVEFFIETRGYWSGR